MEVLRVELTIAELQVHRVVDFELERAMGQPGRARVDLRMLDEVPPEALLGQSASLHFGYGAFEHVFTGVIDKAAAVATTEQGTEASWRLKIELTSHLGLLDHAVTSRIFQELSVPDIVSAVLEEHGLPASKQQWRLEQTYPAREYCVQYDESALSFCQRLLEKEGIFYSLRSSDDGEKIVFEDASAGCDPLDGEVEIPFVPASGERQDEQVIHTIADRHRVTCGAVTLRDYDFEKPDLDLTCEVADGDDRLAVYDFPGGYLDAGEGKRYARVQLEAERAERHRLSVVANCARLMEGRHMTLTSAPGKEGDYLVTAVTHRYQAVDGGEPTLRAEASLLPVDIPFRTPQRTEKPIIDGPQTASVVAPEGVPPETIHTDPWGRCKVKFHWDLGEARDDRASCWIRTQQLQTTGSMILPRVDWEVVVEFQQGDPDRPLVTGRLYNGRYKPPYELPEGKTRSALGSATSPGGGGRNEIRFEDAAGKEEISIKAEKNLSMATGNNKTKKTGNDDSQSVAANRTLDVGANQTIRVTSGYQNSVTGTQTQSVGANRDLGVDAVLGLSAPSFTASVGGNQLEMDGNPLAGLIDLAADMAEDAAKKKAKDMMAQLDEAVKGKVDAVMDPIEDIQGKLDNVQKGLDAAKNGDLSGMADAAAETAGLPTPEEFGNQMKDKALGGAKDAVGKVPGAGFAGAEDAVDDAAADLGLAGEKADKQGGDGGHGGGDDTVAKKGNGPGDHWGGPGGDSQGASGDGGGGSSAPEKSTKDQAKDLVGAAREGELSKGSGLDKFVNDSIEQGIDKGASALKDGLGVGQSGKNFPGPPGGVSGNAAADNKCGPGHSIHKVTGAYSESIGALRATVAVSTINTNIGGTRTQTIGGGRLELVNGTRAEACGDKTETAAGLLVVTGGDEGEAVGGTKTTNIGGAQLAKVGGNCKVAAGGPAAFIGAVHKVDASAKITFNCGGSSVIIDGGGITIKSPMVTIAGATITWKSTVAEGPGGGAGGGGGAGPGGATGGSGGSGGGPEGGEGGGGGGGATTGGSGQDEGDKDGRGKGADQGKDKDKKRPDWAPKPPDPPVTDDERKLAEEPGNTRPQRDARQRVVDDALAKQKVGYWGGKDEDGNPAPPAKERPITQDEADAQKSKIDTTKPVSADGEHGVIYSDDYDGEKMSTHNGKQTVTKPEGGTKEKGDVPGYPPEEVGNQKNDAWEDDPANG